MDGFIKIPNSIRKDENLNRTDIILYWVIDGLCKIDGNVCRPSNQYLSNLLWVSIRTIIRSIKVLSDKWYIIIGGDKNVTEGWQTCRTMVTKMSPNIDIRDKHISKDICYTHELLEAYKNDSQLPKMMDDLEIVEERVEYKQAKKSRAYKKVKWFLQQMKVSINKVRNNEARWDTKLRFRFAVNQSMEWERKWIFRNDKIEAEYQARKKLYLLEQKQNE